jgi:hypothetical protein
MANIRVTDPATAIARANAHTAFRLLSFMSFSRRMAPFVVPLLPGLYGYK